MNLNGMNIAHVVRIYTRRREKRAVFGPYVTSFGGALVQQEEMSLELKGTRYETSSFSAVLDTKRNLLSLHRAVKISSALPILKLLRALSPQATRLAPS